jgi:hypothetical protein
MFAAARKLGTIGIALSLKKQFKELGKIVADRE